MRRCEKYIKLWGKELTFMYKGLIFLLVTAFSVVVVTISPADAETMYITDQIEVTFRRGPGQDYRILSMLKSGQPVEILKKGEDWTHVKLPGGKTGYVIDRYLSDQKPIQIAYQELKERLEVLKSRTDQSILEENAALKENNRLLSEKLAEREKRLADLEQKYERLQRNSENVLELTAEYEKAEQELDRFQQEMAGLRNELDRRTRSRSILWFLAGGGVLLLGILIGRLYRGRRRRASLLV
jgi:SH3 domain protein